MSWMVAGTTSIRRGNGRMPMTDVTVRGVYLPFLALMITVLLIISGLAIDFSRYYLFKQKVQRAVDAAAASAGQGLRAVPPAFTQRSASDYVRYNLSMSGTGVPWPVPTNPALDLPGLSIQSIVSQSGSSTANGRLEVSAALPVPLSLLRLIPGVQLSLTATSRAVVGTPPVAVALVLDVSGSMDAAAGAGGRKIDRLRDGALQFVDLLEDGDYVGIVLFGGYIPSQGVRAMERIWSGGDGQPNTRAAIRTWLTQRLTHNNLHGWTCIGCGILRGRYTDMLLHPDISSMPRHMVVFTDGVPEYARSASGAYDSMRRLPGNRPEYIIGSSSDYRTNCGWPAGTGQQGQIMEAIVESDLTRRAGITVHSIGVGWYPTNNTDYCTGSLRVGSQNISVRNPWQSRISHTLEVAYGDTAVFIAGGTAQLPRTPIDGNDCANPEVANDEVAEMNCGIPSNGPVPCRMVGSSLNRPSGMDDLGVLRPYVLYRLSNDLVNDLPYNPGTASSTAAFPPMLYKRLSPFTGSYTNVNPPAFNPPTVAEIQACNNNPFDRSGWPCECLPFIGPQRPRGVTLLAQTGSEIVSRFQDVLIYIKRPKLVQ